MYVCKIYTNSLHPFLKIRSIYFSHNIIQYIYDTKNAEKLVKYLIGYSLCSVALSQRDIILIQIDFNQMLNIYPSQNMVGPGKRTQNIC